MADDIRGLIELQVKFRAMAERAERGSELEWGIFGVPVHQGRIKS